MSYYRLKGEKTSSLGDSCREGRRPWVLQAFEKPAVEAEPARLSMLRGRMGVTHLYLLQAPETAPGTVESLGHGAGLLPGVKSHFIKKTLVSFHALLPLSLGLSLVTCSF